MLAAALAGLYVAASTHTQQMAEADLIDSEQRYRSLLAAAPDLVVRFEANGDCYAANHPSWLPREGVDPVLDALRWSCQGAGRAVLNAAEPPAGELTVRALAR